MGVSKLMRLYQCAQTEQELVSDAEIDAAWGGANFGGMDRRDVVRQGVLKCQAGWHQGHTSMTICQELGLINHKYKVTTKGRLFLWLAFKLKVTV